MNKPAWTRTRITEKLGIDYPIIQGPFGGFASQRLSATVSNLGGLGSLGANALAPEAIPDAIAEIRILTNRPFAVNLWVSVEDEEAASSDEQAFARSLAPLAHHFHAIGASLPVYKPYVPTSFERQVRAVLDANVPVFSFIVGVPPREILDECRQKGIVTIGTATTPDEARIIEDAGVDIVVASGFEAGGHRGSFLRSAEESLMGTFSLVPQVADAVSIPVAAAGGIADSRGIAAALALGAEAVQIGTAFLACKGSGASEYHREALLSGKSQTGLTKAFTGRMARGLRNQLMDDLNRPDVEVLPYPLQRYLVRSLTTAAGAANRHELLSLWSGQSVNLVHCPEVADLMAELVEGVVPIAQVIGGERQQVLESLQICD